MVISADVAYSELFKWNLPMEIARLKEIRQYGMPHAVFRFVHEANTDYTRFDHTAGAGSLLLPILNRTKDFTPYQKLGTVIGVHVHDTNTPPVNPHLDRSNGAEDVLVDKIMGQGEFTKSQLPRWIEEMGYKPDDLADDIKNNTVVARTFQAIENLSHIMIGDSLVSPSSGAIAEIVENAKIDVERGGIFIPSGIVIDGTPVQGYLERNRENVLRAYRNPNWKGAYYRAIFLRMLKRSLNRRDVSISTVYEITDKECLDMLCEEALTPDEQDALWVAQNARLKSGTTLTEPLFYETLRLVPNGRKGTGVEVYQKFRDGTEIYYNKPSSFVGDKPVELIPSIVRIKTENIRVGNKGFPRIEELSLGVYSGPKNQRDAEDVINGLFSDEHFGPFMKEVSKKSILV